MSAGRIEIKHIFPDETDYIIWTIRKTTNLLTLVSATFYDGVTTLTGQTKFVYPAPHPQSVMVLTDIDPVMYLATAYRSADGVSLDQELNVQLAIDASTGAQYATTTYEYVVDRGYNNVAPVATGSEVWNDPVSGQNELRDERLLNKTYFVIERGTSRLLTSEITDRSDDGGGFDFATSGKNFETEGVYFVIVQNRLDVSPVTGSGGSDFDDVVLITANLTFDTALHANKVLVSAYAGANKVVTLTMPNLSLIDDCKFRIQTHAGTQRYIAMQLDAGDTVEAYGGDYNVLYFGKGELVEVLIISNVMYIISGLPGYDKLGQRIWGDRVEQNTLRRDGTLYNQEDVPRLMQFIDNLAGGQVVAEGVGAGQWGYAQVIDGKTVYPYKGFFARDDVAATPTIRVPDDRNRFIRALLADTGDTDRTTQGAGGYQVDSVGDFSADVTLTKGFSYTGSPNNTIVGNGSNTPQSKVIAMTFDTGYSQTKPENIGMIPLLCI